MAYFSELNAVLNLSCSMLLENQNLCKLLYYYPEETNYQFNPLTQPDIQDTSSLLMKHIYPLPKIPDAETEQICFIDVTISGGKPCDTNPRFREVTLGFDIICHLDTWIIKGGFRPLSIVHEIDSMFNFQETKMDILNRPIANPLIPKNYSNMFYGYHLSYDLQVNSNIKCE